METPTLISLSQDPGKMPQLLIQQLCLLLVRCFYKDKLVTSPLNKQGNRMTIFTDKAVRYIPRLQVDLGITREQACGIFGNLGTETGGFTALQEIKPTVAGSRGGYGW